jgi:hypothetical protein
MQQPQPDLPTGLHRFRPLRSSETVRQQPPVLDADRAQQVMSARSAPSEAATPRVATAGAPQPSSSDDDDDDDDEDEGDIEAMVAELTGSSGMSEAEVRRLLGSYKGDKQHKREQRAPVPAVPPPPPPPPAFATQPSAMLRSADADGDDADEDDADDDTAGAPPPQRELTQQERMDEQLQALLGGFQDDRERQRDETQQALADIAERKERIALAKAVPTRATAIADTPASLKHQSVYTKMYETTRDGRQLEGEEKRAAKEAAVEEERRERRARGFLSNMAISRKISGKAGGALEVDEIGDDALDAPPAPPPLRGLDGKFVTVPKEFQASSAPRKTGAGASSRVFVASKVASGRSGSLNGAAGRTSLRKTAGKENVK